MGDQCAAAAVRTERTTLIAKRKKLGSRDQWGKWRWLGEPEGRAEQADGNPPRLRSCADHEL